MNGPDPMAHAGAPCAPGPSLVVTNAPAGSSAAAAVLERLRSRGPVAVLVAGGAAVPDGVTAFRARPRSPKHNVPILRACVGWLRGGDTLVVLRGAEAAGPLHGRIAEARWGRLVRGLARLAGARVVAACAPVPGSRLARIWHDWLPRRGTRIADDREAVRIGDALPLRKLAEFEEEFEVSRYLRLRLGMLGASAQGRGIGPRHGTVPRHPVAPGPDPAALAAEIDALGAEEHLRDAGDLTVHCAAAGRIPGVLRELGRLRELTFRAVGEGTGGDVDLDVYDDYYLHLFLWHRGRGEVVGGYRLGPTDTILARFGKKGLYSHSLFRLRTRLLEQIRPAIELGRSFVRPEYQREYAPLMLLWKGIAEYVKRNPRYRVLFGPVSISADYETTSQQLLVDFLTLNGPRDGLARQVRPRRPFRGKRGAIWRRAGFAGIDSIEDVSELIAQLEADAKGVPVLLRQYLKLGGRILGFNVDDQFSDVLDGLIMVDLLEADRRVVDRYLGRAGADRFRAWHEARARGVGAAS